MRPRRLTAILVFLGLSASCDALTGTDSTSTTTTTAGAPVIEMDPASFLATCASSPDGSCIPVNVVCADLPGAMQSYVVTFTDYGPADTSNAAFPITLASSPPTPCSQRVTYTQGIIGHRYVADVDGYEQPAAEIVPVCSVRPAYAVCADESTKAPLGNGTCTTDSDCFANGCYGRCIETRRTAFDTANGACLNDNTKEPLTVKACDYQSAAGDRHVVQKGAWTPVSPRWTTPSGSPCGYRNLTPVGAFEQFSVGPCEPLEDRGSDVVTGIVVKPLETLGSLGCYVETQIPDPNADGGVPLITVSTGTITKLDVVPTDPKIQPEKGLDCTTLDQVVFTTGIAPGTEYTFTVFGYDATHLSPTYRSTCVASALDGVEVVAKCVPLTPIASNAP